MITNRIRFAEVDRRTSGEVRAEMARRRISQRQIANAIGMHTNVFARKYRGEIPFTNGELAEVAAALDLTASELMRRAEENDYRGFTQ